MSGFFAALVDGVEGMAGALAQRWLAYGDGLFESIAVHDGHMPLLPLHFARLSESCVRLKLPAPDLTQLHLEATQLAKRFPNSVLKIIVGAGGGARGYARSDAPLVRALLAYPAPIEDPALWQHGLAICLCETRLAHQPLLAGMKHLNRLEQVMARAEWADPTIADGLMLDAQSLLVCATSANVFVRIGGRWCTPEIRDCGVNGVMRAHILQANPHVEIRTLSQADLQSAEAIALTNAVRGARPVGVLRLGHREINFDSRFYDEIGAFNLRRAFNLGAQQATELA